MQECPKIPFMLGGGEVGKDFPYRYPIKTAGTMIFLLNRAKVYPLSTMTLLRADCLTPIQLLVRFECYLYSYQSASHGH